MRHAALSAISLNSLQEMADALNLRISSNTYEQSQIISVSKWNKTSQFPELFRDVIFKEYGYRIPNEYFRESQLYKKPTLNEIYAESLPPLFEYQKSISDQIIKLLNEKSSKAMVQMPTGSGKTRTAMNAITSWVGNNDPKFNGFVVWMAHTEELCEQAIESFDRTWLANGNGAIQYFRYYGSRKIRKSDLSGGVVFCTLQKLYSSMKNEPENFITLPESCSV